MSAIAKATDPRGLKRVCASCGIRFYDLNKRPIACPNCSTEFSGEIKVKGRRSRIIADDQAIEAKGKKAAAPETDEDDILPEDAETVSLEELEEDAGDDEEEAAGDLELDDEDLEVLEEIDEEDLEDLDEDIKIEDKEE